MAVGENVIRTPPPWSLGEFLEWEARQDGRYELISGQPRLMTGRSQAHSTIIANIVRSLGNSLLNSPCRPSGDNLRVPIPGTGNSRYPDAVVDCGELDPTAIDASEPTVVFEVLSKSNSLQDQWELQRDYDTVRTIQCYVVVEQAQCLVLTWLRDKSGRLVIGNSYRTLDDALVLDLEGTEIRLPLGEIYHRLSFET